ncbi:hypothetical protein BDV98DRAFT_539933, partial [Pterulicium gracile]
MRLWRGHHLAHLQEPRALGLITPQYNPTTYTHIYHHLLHTTTHTTSTTTYTYIPLLIPITTMDFLKNVTRDDRRIDGNDNLPVDHEQPPRQEGFLDKLAQRLNDDDKPNAPAPVKPQAPPAGEEPSFFDRLQDKISPPPPRPITPPPPPPPATLGDKISDFFSGNSEPKVAEHVAPPAPPKEE